MGDVERLAALLKGAKRGVALTGAGVSTESGIPDFRSPDSGLWKEHDPMEIASLEGFRREPRAFYAFWGERFGALAGAQPNVTHHVLARLERQGRLRGVVTQNIDGLHHDAGSETVLEVHGSYRQARCVGCRAVYPLADMEARVKAGRLPFCDACGEFVKPDVVLFGEDLPPLFREAERLTELADVFLVLGSSLQVHPVAGLVALAHRHGARLAIVNREPSPYDELAEVLIHAELGATMRALASLLD